MRYARHNTRTSIDAARTMLALESAVDHLGLDRELLDLVKLRVSQINGCAWCAGNYGRVPLHRHAGGDRANALNAWRLSPLFCEPERAVLAWTETLTLAGAGCMEVDHERLAHYFDEHDCLLLTTAIVALNEWSRIASRLQPEPLL